MNECARYSTKEPIGAFEINNSETRIVKTPEPDQTLDHRIADVRANQYILKGPGPLTKCMKVGCDHSRIH